MPVVEKFLHIPLGTVTSGGTTAPAQGTSEAWTVTATTAFPAAVASTFQFHVCDPAANSELMLVTVSPGGTGAGQSWTVTRGVDGTPTVAHSGGFTIYQVTAASWEQAPTFAGNVFAAGSLTTTNNTLDDGSGNGKVATLLTVGGFETAARHITANYTTVTSDFLITADPTAGSIVVTVPNAAAGNAGRMIAVVQTTGGGNIVFIEDASSNVVGSTFHQFEVNIVQSDGSNWYVISNPVTTGSQTWNGQKQFAGGINVTAGIQFQESTQTANYSLSNNNDTIVLMNGASLTATLPQALFVGGEIHVIKNLNASSLTVATTSSQTIDGSLTVTLTQNQAIVVASDGSNWQILASNGTGAFLPLAGGTMTGGEVLAAGTTSLIPLKFQSGTLNTTATAGAEEYDGTCFYATAAASSRQVVDAEQFTALTTTFTLTNTTAAQQLFNASANGALTVQGSTSYWFECEFDITGLSSSLHSVQFGLALGGGATVTSIKYLATSNLGAAGTFAAWSSAIITSASATTLHAGTTTNTTFQAILRGIIRINAGGTITPQVTQVTAAAAAVVGANSWFRIWPCGSNTVADVGDWS